MKLKQAWGWLMAAVVAAGLNAGYHDGAMAWAHQIADRVGHNSVAVLALASGRTDRFLSEARFLTVKQEDPACPFAAALAQARAVTALKASRIEREGAGLEVVSARRVAQFDRWEADRARLEARIVAQANRLRAVQMGKATEFGRIKAIDCSWSRSSN